MWDEHVPAMQAWGQIQGCLRAGFDGQIQGIDWACAQALLQMTGIQITPALTASLLSIEAAVIRSLSTHS